MKRKFRHASGWLLLCCCCLSLLPGCGDNSPRKFAHGFRELPWRMPLKDLPGPGRVLTPERPLFPFDADAVVRETEARTLGHIPVVRLAYAFTKDGFQAVRIEFVPEFLEPVRCYFQDSFGQPRNKGEVLFWEGNKIRVKLFSTAPGGPFALILGPETG